MSAAPVAVAGRVLPWLEGELLRAGSGEARTEALFMLSHLTGIRPADLLAGREKGPEGPAADCLETLSGWIERRRAREPLQYILGTAGFMGLDFIVEPAVLIPRPETEHVVIEGLRFLRDNFTAGAPARVLDLCTGSGCIAVSIAVDSKGAEVLATDASAGALLCAGRNAARSGVADRVKFLEGDLFGALDDASAGDGFDLIVSNPPYVVASELAGLEPEVVEYEPRVALDGGRDGFLYIAVIIRGAPAFLRPGGALVMELGCGQADAARGLTAETGAFRSIKLKKDYSGIERVLVAVTGKAG